MLIYVVLYRCISALGFTTIISFFLVREENAGNSTAEKERMEKGVELQEQHLIRTPVELNPG